MTDAVVTAHEKESLPVHVENCAQRWSRLDKRMQRVEYVMYALIAIVLLGGKDGVAIIKQLFLS